MRCFLDRSVGSKILPGLLREAGWLVETMDERYGRERSQSIADSTWIDELSSDETALTSDRKIGKVSLQAEAIRRTSARILVIGASMTARDQALRLLESQSLIERVVATRSGPWILSVGASALRDLRMHDG